MSNLVRGTGSGNAYHVEHILARNDESRGLFKTADDKVDEELFENERNRFGGLLLLKGRDNESSGNEDYAKKLDTYIGKAPYFAQTLASAFYKSHSSMKDFCERTGLQFAAIPQFTRAALEQRSKLLYEITKKIWGV